MSTFDGCKLSLRTVAAPVCADQAQIGACSCDIIICAWHHVVHGIKHGMQI